MDNWLYRLTRRARPALGLYWRFRMVGALDAIPTSGPLIVAANHVSFLDPWYMCLMFPRDIRFLVTRKWFFKSAFWAWFFRGYGCLPVAEEGPDATQRDVCELLLREQVVGLFPEGRISYDGRMNRFRTGVAFIAAHSGAPVVPIGIRGAFESLPRSRRFPRPGAITLHVGEPIHFPGAPHGDAPPSEAVLAFRDELARAIACLSGQTEPAAEAPETEAWRPSGASRAG